MPWFRSLSFSTPRRRAARACSATTRLSLEVLESRTLLSADPSLTLVLASHTIAENAGPAATTGTITRNNMDTAQALTVNLTSSNPDRATVPASVTIAAGAASATFNVDTVDNGVFDPTQTVTITATAASPLPAGLDSTFGSGGFASVPLRLNLNGFNPPDVKVQLDGKIVAVAATPTIGAAWAVSRTLADGTPDASFGNNGTVVTTFPGWTSGSANGIAFQPDGKIIVVGAVTSSTRNTSGWGIARYNADGTLDTTFGSGGLLLLFKPGQFGELYDAAVLPDGKILISGTDSGSTGGFAVARLTSNGQIDTSFGSGGFANINPNPQAMIVQPDGKILMSGLTSKNLAVVRLNADGTPDTTFNGSGTQLIPLSTFGSSYTFFTQGNGLALQSDGKVLVVGSATHGLSGPFNTDWVVARLNPDGTLDTSFSGDGVDALDFAGGNDNAYDVAVQADGKILVGGGAAVSGGTFLALARYNTDGTLDQTFNGTGELTTQGHTVSASIWGMDLQADGKLATIAGSGSDMQIVRYDTGLLAASDSLSVIDTDDGPPLAIAGGPYTVPEGGSVRLDASRTTSPAQDPSTLTYLWDFDGDGIVGETGADAARGDEVGISPVFSAADLNGPGTYIARLNVIDARGLSSLTKAIINITNVNPSVNIGGDVILNEGDTLTRTGSFTDPGPDSWTAAVDYGDGSGIQPLTLSSDKTFNLSHVYADNGSYRVSVIVTDSDGGSGPGTFMVTVSNVAPTATLSNSGPVDENSPVIVSFSNQFDPSSADTQAGFRYSFGTDPAQLATSYAGATDGPSESFTFPDGPAAPVVYARIFDKDGGFNDYQMTVTVNDVAPAASVSDPTTSVRGQAQTFTVTAADVSPVDQAAGFNYFIDWGDSSTTSLTGSGSVPLSHVFSAAGTYTVQVWATDKDGEQSSQPGTLTVTVTAAALQGDDLVVGGTTGNDTIVLKPADTAGDILVSVNGTQVGSYHPTGRILVYAQAGADNVQLQSAKIGKKTVSIAVPAFLFGGDGNDTLNASGSSANNVLVGGEGDDTLTGGRGRDILIGGGGADALHGGNGDDILIGGVTKYDTDVAALTMLLAEWGRTDLSYLQRIDHLDGNVAGGLNGSTYLNAHTVFDDFTDHAALDQLFGQRGSDWFIALNDGFTDSVNDLRRGEVVTPMAE